MVQLRPGSDVVDGGTGSDGGDCYGAVMQQTFTTESDAENSMDGVGTKICGQGVLNKLVGRTKFGQGVVSDLSAFYAVTPANSNASGARQYTSAVALNSASTSAFSSNSKAHISTIADSGVNAVSTTGSSSNHMDKTSLNVLEKLAKYLAPTNTSRIDFHQGSSNNTTYKDTDDDRSRNVQQSSSSDSTLNDSTNTGTRMTLATAATALVSNAYPHVLPESRDNSSHKTTRHGSRTSQKHTVGKRQLPPPPPPPVSQNPPPNQPQQQQQQQPISNFFHSFRSQPWTLTLPAVLEETLTCDTDDLDGVSSPHQGVRSPVESYHEPIIDNNINSTGNNKNGDSKDNDTKLEILRAMKELILKQQEALRDLSNENLQYREQILSYQDDMKKLRDAKKESQQRIITLVLQKESHETEADLLRDEVKSLREAVREIQSKSSDTEIIKRYHVNSSPQLNKSMDSSNHGTHNNSNYRSSEQVSKNGTMNPNSQEEEEGDVEPCDHAILPCSSSSSLSSFDNMDGMGNKPSFRYRTKKNNSNYSMDDDFIPEESHEVVIVTSHDNHDDIRDDVEDSGYNNDERRNNNIITREVLVLGEKYAMKTTHSNLSLSNMSSTTYEWDKSGTPSSLASRGDGGDANDSRSVTSSAAEEVATFKSRLGSIQRRRLSRQQSKQAQKNDTKFGVSTNNSTETISGRSITPKRSRSPVVRFH